MASSSSSANSILLFLEKSVAWAPCGAERDPAPERFLHSAELPTIKPVVDAMACGWLAPCRLVLTSGRCGAQSVILPFSQRRAVSEQYTNRTVANCTPLAGSVSAASVGLPANNKASQPDFTGPGPENFTTPDAGTCCGSARPRLLSGCGQGTCGGGPTELGAGEVLPYTAGWVFDCQVMGLQQRCRKRSICC